MSFALPLDFAPIEARTAAQIPAGAAWQFEPKWDGFRCLAFRRGAAVALRSKAGQDLGRYFPEVVARLAALPSQDFVLDGELVMTGGVQSFDTLLLRIHPAASRIAKLAHETPAAYLVFDVLAADGSTLVERPLRDRRAVLEAFARANFETGDIRLSPATTERSVAEAWFPGAGASLDGVVAKRVDAPYGAGSRDAMVKVKRARTADCVAGGYRLTKSGDGVASLLLGLYADGELDYVGFTSGFTGAERKRLLPELKRLHAASSFQRRAPGGPSRWSEKSEPWQPVRPELVFEVGYDQVTALRFRHGTRILRRRPDKAPEQCTIDQIASPAAALDEVLDLLSMR
jgi:ATP-dependent DNA ligase